MLGHVTNHRIDPQNNQSLISGAMLLNSQQGQRISLIYEMHVNQVDLYCTDKDLKTNRSIRAGLLDTFVLGSV